MKSRTSGEDCGNQDGDLLSWTNSSWTLHGAARWGDEVSIKDLCREFSSIQLLSTQRVTKPDYCRYLCEKMHGEGRMASVETQELHEKLQGRLRMLAPHYNTPSVLWLPVKRQNGLWSDIYTKKPFISTKWNKGFPNNDTRKGCVIATSKDMANHFCTEEGALGGFYCSCQFPEHPFLTLRGLCEDSYLDQTYLSQNSPVDGETTFYGNRISVARYLKEDLTIYIQRT